MSHVLSKTQGMHKMSWISSVHNFECIKPFLIPLSALGICYSITGTLVFYQTTIVLLCDHVTLIHEIWIIQFTWLLYFVMCWEKSRIAQGSTLLLSD